MTAKSLCLTQVLFGTGFLIVFFLNNFSLFKKTSSCVFRRAGHLYTLEFLVSSHWSFWFDHSTLLINYALLMLPKKRWWGQRVLFMRAIFRICGNESQPGLQIIQSWLRPSGHSAASYEHSAWPTLRHLQIVTVKYRWYGGGGEKWVPLKFTQ